jgi:hypothetical protein
LACGGDDGAAQQNVSELSTARAFVAPGAANALYHAHISGSPSLMNKACTSQIV